MFQILQNLFWLIEIKLLAFSMAMRTDFIDWTIFFSSSRYWSTWCRILSVHCFFSSSKDFAFAFQTSRSRSNAHFSFANSPQENSTNWICRRNVTSNLSCLNEKIRVEKVNWEKLLNHGNGLKPTKWSWKIFSYIYTFLCGI